MLHITANERKLEEKAKKGLQLYDCPVYKYAARTDRYFIFFANLPAGAERSPNQWILRGVSLLLNEY